MMETQTNQDSTQILEDLLVGQFRLYQSLVDRTREERQALVNADVPALITVVEAKDSLIQELSRLERARAEAMRRFFKPQSEPQDDLSVVQLIDKLAPDNADRLSRLREGILVLIDELRQLTGGNRSLAYEALGHLDALQTYLFHLDGSGSSYQPPGRSASRDPNSPAEVERWA